jgi:hypothetical protein
LVGDSIAESQVFWNKVSQGNMASHTGDVLRIERWLQSSENDDTYGTAFVHLWTAFNAIWGLLRELLGKNATSEVWDMEWAVKILLRHSSTRVREVVTTDISRIAHSQQPWEHGRKPNEDSAELKDALAHETGQNPLKVLVAALRCAYAFRCRLFHEAQDPTWIAEWSPVFSHLLRQVTTACLFGLTQLQCLDTPSLDV